MGGWPRGRSGSLAESGGGVVGTRTYRYGKDREQGGKWVWPWGRCVRVVLRAVAEGRIAVEPGLAVKERKGFWVADLWLLLGLGEEQCLL